MRRLAIAILAVAAAGSVAFAHNGNDHVRGVVTAVSPTSITVQTTAKTTRVLTVTPKTTFQQNAKSAHLADLKVGDRVVVDVPEKTNNAVEVQIGAAPGGAAAVARLGSWSGNVVKQGTTFVFVSNGKTYKISNTEKVSPHVGHPVTLTGQLAGDTITVSSVAIGKG
jgi:preprotein translocase subunit SecF